MNYCGIDLGKKFSHFCIVDSERRRLGEGRVRTVSEDLAAQFGNRERMKIVIEASTKSFWVADILVPGVNYVFPLATITFPDPLVVRGGVACPC